MAEPAPGEEMDIEVLGDISISGRRCRSSLSNFGYMHTPVSEGERMGHTGSKRARKVMEFLPAGL